MEIQPVKVGPANSHRVSVDVHSMDTRVQKKDWLGYPGKAIVNGTVRISELI